jgi:hypothetical protein
LNSWYCKGHFSSSILNFIFLPWWYPVLHIRQERSGFYTDPHAELDQYIRATKLLKLATKYNFYAC